MIASPIERDADNASAGTPNLPFAQLAQARLDDLRPAERRVADFLLTLDPASPSATAGAVAMALGVSQATVVNTVQRLGYAGFGDFRRRLIAERAIERATQTVPPLARSVDPLVAIRQRVFADDAAALQTTGQLMDDDAFRQAVLALRDAPQVLCIGTGWSGVLARLAAGTFTKYGIRATGEDLGIEQLALVEVVERSTLLFVVSHRGRAPDLLTAVERARYRGMTIIALTHRGSSPLARAASIVLVCGGPLPDDTTHPNQTSGPATHLTTVRALAEAVSWLQTADGQALSGPGIANGRYADSD